MDILSYDATYRMPGTTQTINPAKCHTLSQFITNGEYAPLKYNYFCLFTKYESTQSNIYVPIYNVLDEYTEDLKNISTLVSVDNDMLVKYNYKPKVLAYDLYGYTDMYYIILKINDIYNPKDFANFKYLNIITNKTKLVNTLTTIYNANKDYIDRYNSEYLTAL